MRTDKVKDVVTSNETVSRKFIYFDTFLWFGFLFYLLPAKEGPRSQPSHEGDGTRTCIAFQLAAFLKEIAGSRHAVLSQLKKGLGGDSQDPPLQSQGPMGRVSLDRQDFE